MSIPHPSVAPRGGAVEEKQLDEDNGSSSPTVDGHKQMEGDVRHFHFGLWSCADDLELALDVALCAPCHQSRQFSASHGQPYSMSTSGCLLSTACCCPAALWIRRNVVRLGSLDERLCRSCLVSFCCPCLSACQVSRQLAMMGCPPGNVVCVPSCPAEQQQMV